jgi:hypothetical protein
MMAFYTWKILTAFPQAPNTTLRICSGQPRTSELTNTIHTLTPKINLYFLSKLPVEQNFPKGGTPAGKALP